MFAGVEDITGSVKPTQHDISAADNRMTMLKYMELEQDFAIAENEAVKGEHMQLQLEQMLSMYDHVKQFGVDRTFLALYNNDGQLGRAIGVKFPGFESMDCVGVPTSTYSQMFIAAMEDENGGLLSKLWQWIKLLWESLKKIATVVWEKIKSFFGSADKSDASMLQQIQTLKDDAKVSTTIKVVKQWALRAIIAGIFTWVGKVISNKVFSVLDDTFIKKGDRETLMKHVGIDSELIEIVGGVEFKKWASTLEKYAKDLDGAKDKVNEAFDKIAKDDQLKNFINSDPKLKDEYARLNALHEGVDFNYEFNKNKYDGRAEFKQEGWFKSIFTKAGRAIKFHKNEADNAAREIVQLRILVHKGIQKLYEDAQKKRAAQNPKPTPHSGGNGNSGNQNAPAGNNKNQSKPNKKPKSAPNSGGNGSGGGQNAPSGNNGLPGPVNP